MVNDEIYVIGGFDNISNRFLHYQSTAIVTDCSSRYLSSVEKYNPERGRWSKLSGLSLPRRSPGVVAYRDRLYVVGGIFYIRGGIKSVFFLLSVKRRGGLAQSKKSLSEKTEVVKKGGGRLRFFTKSKKNIFYASPKPIFHNYFGIVGRIFSYVPNIVYFHIGGRDGGEGGLEQRRGVLHNIVANSEVANLSLFQVFCPSSNEWSKMAKPMTEVNGWCSACLGSFLLL